MDDLKKNSTGSEQESQDIFKIVEKVDIYKNYIFPSLSKRVQALFIDAVIIFLVFWGSSYIFSFIKDVHPLVRIGIFLFMIFLYEPTFIFFFKGTIGHQISNIKVTKFDNPENKLSFISSIFRFIVKWFFGWLSFISIFLNNKNRAMHDIASNSIVTFYENEKSTKS